MWFKMHFFIIVFMCQDHVRPTCVSNYCCFPQRVHFLLEVFLFLPMNCCWDERNSDNRALHPTCWAHLCICTVGSFASLSVRLCDVTGPKLENHSYLAKNQDLTVACHWWQFTIAILEWNQWVISLANVLPSTASCIFKDLKIPLK